MESFKKNLPEYLMEAAELGLFMIAAGLFTCLFEYPNSPLHQAISNGDLRRFLIGIAMGSTAIALIYSPWGQQSGAHMNPAVTLTFYRLGKVKGWDVLFYILFQCLGGLAGVCLVALLLGTIFTKIPIHYIVTVPGNAGWTAALIGELVIAFVMMSMVLLVSNNAKLNRFTGLFSGCLVVLYVFLEAPLSGFGMNPARSFASAFLAQTWTAFWIYLVVPPLGMLLAGVVYQLLFGRRAVKCAKLSHANNKRCIFNCNYARHKKLDLSDRLPHIGANPL
jgi:aquaporin Z